MADDDITIGGQVGEEHTFFTISSNRGDIETFDLKPTFTSLGLPASAFKPEYRGRAGAKTFNAAALGGTTMPGVVWFFMGEDYVRYDRRNQVLGGPVSIAGNWGAGHWPSTYASGVDAVASFTNQPGYVWFFKGATYIRYGLGTDVPEGPEAIAGNWPGFPDEFASGVDAAAEGRGPFEGMGWFFKGSHYIRYNNITNQVDIGPRPIADGWKGWPAEFTSVDCAVPGTGADSTMLYLFSGDKCVPYDLQHDEVAGPVRDISGPFPLLTPFLRRPQLFLVETLSLRSYFGQTMTGVPQAGTRSLDPGESSTYTVIMSRSETTTTVENSTVLESQDQSLLDDLNTTMKSESSQSKSKESYDYAFDSSFNGDLSYTGLGGSVDATLNFQGSSNDVRTAAASAAGSAIQKQVSRATAHRQQSTRVEAGSDVQHSETESTFTKSVTNPTNKAVNLGVFQLIQEYLALLVLSDVQVAFSNGGPADVLTLTALDAGLAKYCADATTASFVRAAIIDELSAILDYQSKPTKVTSDVGDGRVSFAHELQSRWDHKANDGAIINTIVVPGLLLSHKSYNVLTRAMIVKELDFGV